MRLLRGLSLGSFVLGVLVWVVAVGLFLRGVLLPTGGFEDLGFVVGGMLVAGASAVPFALSLVFAARGGGAPRWRVVVATLGCLVGAVMGVVWLQGGNMVQLFLGVPLLVFALLGFWGAWRLRARAS